MQHSPSPSLPLPPLNHPLPPSPRPPLPPSLPTPRRLAAAGQKGSTEEGRAGSGGGEGEGGRKPATKRRSTMQIEPWLRREGLQRSMSRAFRDWRRAPFGKGACRQASHRRAFRRGRFRHPPTHRPPHPPACALERSREWRREGRSRHSFGASHPGSAPPTPHPATPALDLRSPPRARSRARMTGIQAHTHTHLGAAAW